MPRLSDYLHRQQDAAPPPPPTQPAASLFQPVPKPTKPAQPLSQQQQPHTSQQHTQVAAGHAAAAVDGALAAEVTRLQQQHNNRLRQHGARSYRQPDGALSPQAPDKHPYTVASRRKWHGLVQHCRQQPGVNAQVERTGQSARYGINTPHDQHVAALAAAGLAPEFDVSGLWLGYTEGVQDPLTGATHGLRHADWAATTSAVLRRAVEVHGASTLPFNSWDLELYTQDA